MLSYNDLKKYDVIFTDIFDTFVYRNVAPEYVKKTWCNYLVKCFNLPLSMKKLYKERNNIETELCEKSLNSGFDLEFKYDDMLNALYQKNLNYLDGVSFEAFRNICVDMEVQIEKSVQYVDEDVISIFKKLKKDKKKIYCVSDMYLSKNMIYDIFSFHGIVDLFDDIYVSCEILENKKTGKLYKHVLKELNVNPDECSMFGDNYYSDYEIPNNLGIHSFHIDRTEQYNKYSMFDATTDSINYKSELLKLTCSDNNNFEHIIFSLYLFIGRLYFDLIRKGYNEVIFLSREGEFLKKLFDVYVSKINGKKIDSKYLIVSRKSTYLPSLLELKNEKFDSLLNQYSYISLNEFLKSLNFKEDDLSRIILSVCKNVKNSIQKDLSLNDDEVSMIDNIITFDPDRKVPYFGNSAVFRRLINDSVFAEIYEKKRVSQKENFIKYFKQVTDSKDVALVDIGWSGSIQNNISKILGEDYNVNGYYLGIQKRDGLYEKTKSGLVFSNVPIESKDFKLYSTNRTVYEILLGASHGSANEYVEKNGKVEVELFSKKEEREIFENCISGIQENMLSIFSRLCDILNNGFYDNLLCDKFFNDIHFKTMFNPNKSQFSFFNRIYHYENFGVFEFTSFNSKRKLTCSQKVKEYVKFFCRFRTYFDDCFWPVLKLYNNRMYFALLLYRNMKRLQFIRKKII